MDYLIDELEERGMLDRLRIIRMVLVNPGEAGYEVIREEEARETRKELEADLRGI